MNVHTDSEYHKNRTFIHVLLLQQKIKELLLLVLQFSDKAMNYNERGSFAQPLQPVVERDHSLGYPHAIEEVHEDHNITAIPSPDGAGPKLSAVSSSCILNAPTTVQTKVTPIR